LGYRGHIGDEAEAQQDGREQHDHCHVDEIEAGEDKIAGDDQQHQVEAHHGGVVAQKGLGRPQPSLRIDQQEGQLDQDRRREDDRQDFFAQHGFLPVLFSQSLVPKLRLGTDEQA
jgi:hypothetical protein